MRLDRTLVNDVQYFVPMRGVVVADQHPMTLEPHFLGTHNGRWSLLRPAQDLGRGGLEFSGQHVIGVGAEGIVAQPRVRRIVARTSATAAHLWFPPVIYPRFR